VPIIDRRDHGLELTSADTGLREKPIPKDRWDARVDAFWAGSAASIDSTARSTARVSVNSS
jgi:hypothetical protein